MGKLYKETSELESANREIAAHEQFKQGYLDFINRRDWSNDYFVTLTFKSSYKNDEVKRCADIQQYLRMLDQAMLGKDAKKRGRKLYRFGGFELNMSGQPHYHMLLENPGSLRISESKHEFTIIDTWLKMDCSGMFAANKVLRIESTPERVIGYINKDLRVSKSHMYDPNLWHLPLVPN